MRYYYDRLYDDRVIFLNDHITTFNAADIVAQLLCLAREDSQSPIYLWINSPGGVVTEGHAIRSTMNYIKPPVATVGIGQCASMAAVLLCSGEKGMRYCFEDTEIMFHTVSGSTSWGHEKDVLISADRIHDMNTRLLEIIAANCDKDYETVERDLDRDFFLSAHEAVKYGAVDYVLQ